MTNHVPVKGVDEILDDLEKSAELLKKIIEARMRRNRVFEEIKKEKDSFIAKVKSSVALASDIFFELARYFQKKGRRSIKNDR